jgi:xanthine dehydrogenase accessory factor
MMTAVKKQYAYLGFVASRKKSASIIQYLKDAGVEDSVIGTITSPAGLDINAKQPDEVAISILAEIIQVKNGLSVLVQQDVPAMREASASQDAL